jgi:hypothetical protein
MRQDLDARPFCFNVSDGKLVATTTGMSGLGHELKGSQ